MTVYFGGTLDFTDTPESEALAYEAAGIPPPTAPKMNWAAIIGAVTAVGLLAYVSTSRSTR